MDIFRRARVTAGEQLPERLFNKGRIDVNEGQISGDFDIDVMGSKPRTALINGRIDDIRRIDPVQLWPHAARRGARRIEQLLNFAVQPLRLIMYFVPFHAEHFRQHALDQVVAERGTVRRFFALGCKPHNTIGFDLKVSVTPQALDGHGDRRW